MWFGKRVHLFSGQPRLPAVDDGRANVAKRAIETLQQFQGEKLGHVAGEGLRDDERNG